MIFTTCLAILVVAFLFCLGVKCGQLMPRKNVKVSSSATEELKKYKKHLLLYSIKDGVIEVHISEEHPSCKFSGSASINLK